MVLRILRGWAPTDCNSNNRRRAVSASIATLLVLLSSSTCSAADAAAPSAAIATAAAALPKLQLPPALASTTISLVSSPTPTHGRIQKHGHLPVDRWDVRHFSKHNAAFQEWLGAHNISNKVLRPLRSHIAPLPEPPLLTTPPPLSFPCKVIVSVEYRFIYIRQRKTASTTLVDALTDACRHNQLGSCTMAPISPTKLLERMQGWSLERIWNEFTVFTVSRNPYARSVSSYRYLTDEWSHKKGVCQIPTFSTFCKQPMLLGSMAQFLACRHFNAFRTREWDWYHVEPTARCLTTENGTSALDFVVRSERLEEDAAALLRLINARRDPSVPPLQLSFNWVKAGNTLRSAERTATRPAAADAGPSAETSAGTIAGATAGGEGAATGAVASGLSVVQPVVVGAGLGEAGVRAELGAGQHRLLHVQSHMSARTQADGSPDMKHAVVGRTGHAAWALHLARALTSVRNTALTHRTLSQPVMSMTNTAASSHAGRRAHAAAAAGPPESVVAASQGVREDEGAVQEAQERLQAQQAKYAAVFDAAPACMSQLTHFFRDDLLFYGYVTAPAGGSTAVTTPLPFTGEDATAVTAGREGQAGKGADAQTVENQPDGPAGLIGWLSRLGVGRRAHTTAAK